MTHEVNSKWMTTPDRTPIQAPPNDVWNGLIDTPDQQERVGFVNHPKDPGGVTKFGIAQRYNPNVNVRETDYITCRETGYNVYWLAASNNCSSMSPRIACMAFDMNYLLGPSASKRVMQNAGVTGTETGPAELAALDAITAARLAYLKTKPGWSTFGKGWTRRANECLAYCKALP
jgi:lysozyme family protein